VKKSKWGCLILKFGVNSRVRANRKDPVRKDLHERSKKESPMKKNTKKIAAEKTSTTNSERLPRKEVTSRKQTDHPNSTKYRGLKRKDVRLIAQRRTWGGGREPRNWGVARE